MQTFGPATKRGALEGVSNGEEPRDASEQCDVGSGAPVLKTGLSTPVFGAVGAAVGFAAVWFGVPLLGAIERGMGARVAMALIAAGACGLGGALVARGRSAAAQIETAALEGASEALLAHRARRTRVALTSLVVSVLGVGIAQVAVRMFYAHLESERMRWEPEVLVGEFEHWMTLAFGLALGVTFFFLRRPGSFIDEEPLPDDVPRPAGGAAVSDEELDRTAAMVRANMRRASLAKVVAVLTVVGCLGIAAFVLPAFAELIGGSVPTSFYLVVFGGAFGLAVLAHRAIAPKVDVHELLEAPLAPEQRAQLDEAVRAAPASLSETMTNAGRLRVRRTSSVLAWFGFDAGRSYAVDADEVALATAAETLPIWMRLLPARALPYRAQIDDDQGSEPIGVRGNVLGLVTEVSVGDASVGRLRKTPLLRRMKVEAEGAAAALEIRGSFWFRREMSIVRGGDKVGYVQVFRPGGVFGSLLSGQEVTLDLEVPPDASEAERQMLLAALLVLDRRYF